MQNTKLSNPNPLTHAIQYSSFTQHNYQELIT